MWSLCQIDNTKRKFGTCRCAPEGSTPFAQKSALWPHTFFRWPFNFGCHFVLSTAERIVAFATFQAKPQGPPGSQSRPRQGPTIRHPLCFCSGTINIPAGPPVLQHLFSPSTPETRSIDRAPLVLRRVQWMVNRPKIHSQMEWTVPVSLAKGLQKRLRLSQWVSGSFHLPAQRVTVFTEN